MQPTDVRPQMNAPSEHESAQTTLPNAPAGRRATIARDELLSAAMALLGPTRSVSTLSLREIAREAGIAPNSFYRHFHDPDELAVALIEASGTSLRKIFSEARLRAGREDSVVRTAVDVFMNQLHAPDGYLPLLMREGRVGSAAFRRVVEDQLRYFEEELQRDLVMIANHRGSPLQQPHLVARAITRLVFTMGTLALEHDEAGQAEIKEQTITMIRMVIAGAQATSAG